MKLLKSKKFIIVLSVFLVSVITISVGIDLTFNKPTKLNKIVAAKRYKTSGTPANTAFKDQNFYNCVVDAYNDKNGTSVAYTDVLNDEQLQTITSLSCIGGYTADKKINAVDGLQKLVNLTILDLKNNNISNINLTQNINLVELYLGTENRLKSSYADLYGNELTDIDVTKNTKLQKLALSNNLLSKIDLSNNLELIEFTAYNNKLVNVNIEKNEKLEILNLGFTYGCRSGDSGALGCSRSHGNEISTINLNNNTKLKDLYLSYNKLENIDLSKNINLEELQIGANELTNLDVSNCTQLSTFVAQGNQLENIKLSKTEQVLYLNSNNFSNIDLSGNTVLFYLNLSNNQFNNIDLSKNTMLNGIDLSNNNLTRIDLTNNFNLKSIVITKNNLLDFDLSKNTLLEGLDLRNNQLSSIDLTNNLLLERLVLSYNLLEKINLNNNTKLTTLNISNNKLKNISLENNNLLTYINLSDNVISDIDLSKNELISTLYISGNELQKLDLSKNVNLSQNSTYINSYYYGENLYVYKGNEIYAENKVILPKQFDYGEIIWRSKNKDLATVNENGLIKTIKSGSVEIEGRYSTKTNIYTTSKINIVEITSDKYFINEEDDYIVVNSNNQNIIKDNINIPDNISLEIDNNKLNVLYENSILKSFDLIEVISEEYDLGKDYIYVENEEFDKNKITVTNGEVIYEDNQVTLKYNDKILKTYDIVSVNSDTYNLDKNYIYVGTNEFDLSKINITNGTTFIEDNKLIIKYGDKTIKTIDIVSINSNTYNLEKEYIYVGSKDLDKTKISIINGTLKEENDILKIAYDEEVLKEYPILKINSDVYEIGENYIHTKDSGIIQDKIIRTHNMTLNLREFAVNDKYEKEYVLRYNEEEITTFKLVSYSSDIYDLEKDYIYIGSNEIELDKINSNNADISVKNNLLEISFENNILRQIKIVSISSEEYNLNKNYINAGTKPLDKSKITITNGQILEEDNKIKITYNNDVLQTFDIVSYSLGNLRINGKNIIVGNTVSYEDLKDNITGNITYKVYNNDEEVNEIGSLYKLYIYYGEDKIDEYTFITEYLNFDEELESKIDKDNNYILGNAIGTKVSDIKSLIDTSGSISFVDKDNKELTDDSKIGTGSKVKISLSTGDVYYELVVTGDTSGDGRLTVSDLVKINNHIISEDKKLTGVYALASDYDSNGRVTVSDIVKINNKILSN